MGLLEAKLSVVQLMVQYLYLPPRSAEDSTMSRLTILGDVCKKVVQRTGFTLMTQSLRHMWIATQQAPGVSQLPACPAKLTAADLPFVSIFGMEAAPVWAPLPVVLAPPHDGFLRDHLHWALNILTELREVHFVQKSGETDASLILKDAHMVLQSIHASFLVNEHAAELRSLVPLPSVIEFVADDPEGL
eukprot:s4752_g2.t1